MRVQILHPAPAFEVVAKRKRSRIQNPCFPGSTPGYLTKYGSWARWDGDRLTSGYDRVRFLDDLRK